MELRLKLLLLLILEGGQSMVSRMLRRHAPRDGCTGVPTSAALVLHLLDKLGQGLALPLHSGLSSLPPGKALHSAALPSARWVVT